MLKGYNDKVVRHYKMKMPRQDRSIKKVEHILNIVVDFAAEHGADKISTSIIAKEAGVPVGTIYQFFDGKHSLIQSAYERSYGVVEGYAFKEVEMNGAPDDWMDISDRFIYAACREKGFLTLSQYMNLISHIELDTQFSASRLSQYTCDYIAQHTKGISKQDQDVIAQTILNISGTFTMLAIAAKTDELSLRYRKELKLVLVTYFENYRDKSNNTQA